MLSSPFCQSNLVKHSSCLKLELYSIVLKGLVSLSQKVSSIGDKFDITQHQKLDTRKKKERVLIEEEVVSLLQTHWSTFSEMTVHQLAHFSFKIDDVAREFVLAQGRSI